MQVVAQGGATVEVAEGNRAQRGRDCLNDQIEVARVDRWSKIKAVARAEREPMGEFVSEAGWRADEEWWGIRSECGEFIGSLLGLALRASQDRHRTLDYQRWRSTPRR